MSLNKTYEPFLLDPDYIPRKSKSRETHFLMILTILILAAVFLVLFGFFYSQDSFNECPFGYRYFQPTDSCYKLHEKIASFQEAQNTCLLENALLESPQENDLLVELFGDDLKHGFICTRSRNASKKRRDLSSAAKTQAKTENKKPLVPTLGKEVFIPTTTPSIVSDETTDHSAVDKHEAFLRPISSMKNLMRGFLNGDIESQTLGVRKTTADGFEYTSSSPYCYKVYIEQATFAEANATCASHNAHLVSIHSLDEYRHIKFLYDLALDSYKRNVWQYEQAAPFWLGLHYDKEWKWTDGSPADDWTWADGSPMNHWKGGEPKNMGEGFDKAIMEIVSALWTSEKGDVKHSYVCKKTPEKNASKGYKKRRDLSSAAKTQDKTETQTRKPLATKLGEEVFIPTTTPSNVSDETTDHSAVDKHETFGLSVSSLKSLIRGLLNGDIDSQTLEVRKTTPDGCPLGFEYTSSSPYCYKVYIEQATFAEANATCTSHNAHLVSIHSLDEYRHIKFLYNLELDYYKRNVWQYEQAAPIWLGLHFDKEWKWTDGRPAEFKYWKGPWPKNMGEGFDKAIMEMNAGMWTSEKRDVKHSYVCKKTPEKNASKGTKKRRDLSSAVKTQTKTESKKPLVPTLGEEVFIPTTTPSYVSDETTDHSAVDKHEAFLRPISSMKNLMRGFLDGDIESQTLGVRKTTADGFEYTSSSPYCYKVYIEQATFAEANATCASHNAHLVSIHSLDEYRHIKFLYDLALDSYKRNVWQYEQAAPFWLGLHYDKEWKWTDGSPADDWTWADGSPMNHWKGGEPKNMGEGFDKAIMEIVSAMWTSEKGDVKHSYVCKKTPEKNASKGAKKRRDLSSAVKTQTKTESKKRLVPTLGEEVFIPTTTPFAIPWERYSTVDRYETFGLSVSQIKTLISGILDGYIDENTFELRKTTPDGCPFGFDYSYPYCYTVYIDQATFAEANATCASHNAHLVSIHSDEEYLTVKFYYDQKLDYYRRNVWQYEQAAPIWTGLHYDKEWKWTDGSPVEEWTWADGSPKDRWEGGEPKNMGEGFDKSIVDISYPLWKSEKGDVKHSYVCKKSPEKQ